MEAASSKQSVVSSIESANAAKYRAYEKDYLRWIQHKYFSNQHPGKTDPIYENAVPVEGFMIKASKSAPLRSFAESDASVESVGPFEIGAQGRKRTPKT